MMMMIMMVIIIITIISEGTEGVLQHMCIEFMYTPMQKCYTNVILNISSSTLSLQSIYEYGHILDSVDMDDDDEH